MLETILKRFEVPDEIRRFEKFTNSRRVPSFTFRRGLRATIAGSLATRRTCLSILWAPRTMPSIEADAWSLPHPELSL
jgi:hypothetical protein